MSYLPRIIRIENIEDAKREMEAIGVHSHGLDIMAPKAVFRAVKIKNISVTAANILKQDMLSRGGEAATSKGTIDHSAQLSDVILFGTLEQYKSLADRLKDQQFKLPEIVREIENVLEVHEKRPPPILGMEFGMRTYIMGILNVTPDSFSDGGIYVDPEKAQARAKEMTLDGADIIDIGGESTRPGAGEIGVEDEIGRTIPVIEKIVGAGAQYIVPQHASPRPIISIDTRKSVVAEAAVKAGARMINDVSGLRYDAKMAATAASLDVPVIIMHSKGTPDVMQTDPKYEDLISEILQFFEESIRTAASAGVKESNIILDPGIGFGKTTEDNIEIIRRLDEFRCFGRPLCIGVSRKSFIGGILNEKKPEKRDEGTASAVALAISKKVDIIRVHNTGFMRKAALMADAIIRRK